MKLQEQHKIKKNKIDLIKWFDNKAVVMGSNFITSGKSEVIKRWDKKK